MCALLSYFRFKRQCICANEVSLMTGRSDVLVDSDSGLLEIEVKISKSDLWNGEKAKKIKHELLSSIKEENLNRYILPNKFFICVPTSLVSEAIKWVEATNPKYGVLEFRENIGCWNIWSDYIFVIRSAKTLHNKYQENVLKRIAKRLSSENILFWNERLMKQEREPSNA